MVKLARFFVSFHIVSGDGLGFGCTVVTTDKNTVKGTGDIELFTQRIKEQLRKDGQLGANITIVNITPLPIAAEWQNEEEK